MTDNVRNLMCLKCCPKCGGALFRECDIHGCEVECLQCGYVMRKEMLEAMIGKEETEKMLKLTRKRTEEIVEKPKRGRPRKSQTPGDD